MNNENKAVSNSCVMLAANLITPVSLTSVFDSEDLKDTGIVYDPHITILYAREKYLDRIDVLGNIPQALLKLLNEKKSREEWSIPVLNLFDLGNFENDSGYIVLKMKPGNEWYDLLSETNEKLMETYGVKSDFKNYTPHVSLAELEPGTTEKYMENETLKLILKGSIIHFEDLIISYSYDGEDGYNVYDITHWHSVDRFFRIREAKKEDSIV